MTAPAPAERDILLSRYVLLALFVTAGCVYFPWRLTVFNPAAPIFSTLFFAVELVGFVWSFIFFASVLKFPAPSLHKAPEGLAVDVFVPTYNEPINIVRRTVVAALRIRYPHETWVLDDGNRPEMRQMAEELGCHYIARKQNTDAKAGNINNALKEARGEFILLFDADFIAAPDFLDKTLGYFNDPKVAFVQTPQEYHNYDSFQHTGSKRANSTWSEHSLFYRAIQPGRSFYNAAMFCGCAAVLRRAALDDVGGVATGTVTEDMHTSVRLHNSGWDSAYHPETLSAGLAPHDAFSFRRQRLRWAQGAMQVFRREKLIFGSKGLSIYQRISYLLHVAAHMEGLRHSFIYLTPVVTLWFSLSPFKMDLSFKTWLAFTLPLLVISIFSFEDFSRGHGRILLNESYNLSRCTTSIRALFALAGKRYIPFMVTPKAGSRGGFVFPYLVLCATLAAMIKTGWQVWHGTSAITGLPLLIVITWATLSAAMALSLCILTHRCMKNRREFSRVPTNISVVLQKQNGTEKLSATITALSDNGLSFKINTADKEKAESTWTGKLRIGGQDVPFTLPLRKPNAAGITGGAMQWESAAEHDIYSYLVVTDRIKWMRQFDNVREKTLLGAILPRRTEKKSVKEGT